MADRFVHGYVVSAAQLQGLVGSGFSVDKLVARAGEELLEEIVETLSGDGWEISVDEALAHLSAGELDPDLAYVYRRVTELLLHRFALALPGEISVVLTYYLPNQSFGRWNPVLRAMGYPRLARLWAASNWRYPWRRAPAGVDLAWPALTMIPARSLPLLDQELRVAPRQPRESLLTLDLQGDVSVGDSRRELLDGVRQLRRWIARARAPQRSAKPALAAEGNDLLLWMDGDQ